MATEADQVLEERQKNIAAAIAEARLQREYDFEICSRKAEQIIEEAMDAMDDNLTLNFGDVSTDTLRRYNDIIIEIVKYSGYWCKATIKKKEQRDNFRRVRYDMEEMTEEQKAIWVR
jgi:hypothetical protein